MRGTWRGRERKRKAERKDKREREREIESERETKGEEIGSKQQAFESMTAAPLNFQLCLQHHNARTATSVDTTMPSPQMALQVSPAVTVTDAKKQVVNTWGGGITMERVRE